MSEEFNGTGFNIDSDFDVENEWKPTPLVPNGVYSANITEVKTDNEKMSISFVFTLADNGGFMSDGETPIDGSQVTANVFLPKPGDEDEMTTSGKMTKRQAKINMMKQFGDNLSIDITRPASILSALANGDWLGLACKVTISSREWEGRVFNDVKKAVAV